MEKQFMKKLKILIFIISLTQVVNATIIEKDTLLLKNTTLTLEYEFDIFECGINIYSQPTHYITSEIENTNLSVGYKSTYTYLPQNNYIGKDTVIFLTGCGSTPQETIYDTIMYIINVVPTTAINDIDMQSQDYISVLKNGSILINSTQIKNADKIYIYNLEGKTIYKGEIRENEITPKLRSGIYFIEIKRDKTIINRIKIKI